MQVTFLGTDPCLGEGFNSNLLLDLGISGTLLFDCGMDIKLSLQAAKRSVSDINAVYISHPHCDHSGGLEWLSHYLRFEEKKKITLYAHESHIEILWDQLKAALSPNESGEPLTLADYFYVSPLANWKKFMVGQYTFTPIKNKHITSQDGNDMFSYGLVCDRRGTYEYEELQLSPSTPLLYFSSDTVNAVTSDQWPQEFQDLVLSCTSIFHEVDVQNLGGQVHVQYKDMLKLPPEIKQRIWFYHYKNIGRELPDVRKDGFSGYAKPGWIFYL